MEIVIVPILFSNTNNIQKHVHWHHVWFFDIIHIWLKSHFWKTNRNAVVVGQNTSVQNTQDWNIFTNLNIKQRLELKVSKRS